MFLCVWLVEPFESCYRQCKSKPKDTEAANDAKTTNVPAPLETKKEDFKGPTAGSPEAPDAEPRDVTGPLYSRG